MGTPKITTTTKKTFDNMTYDVSLTSKVNFENLTLKCLGIKDQLEEWSRGKVRLGDWGLG